SQDGDVSVTSLLDRPTEVGQPPRRAGVAGGGDEQRVVAARLKGEAASFLVRALGRAAATGELDAQVTKNRQRSLVDPVPRIRETHGSRDAMLTAAIVDGADLGGQIAQGCFRDGLVVAGVIADLETVSV